MIDRVNKLFSAFHSVAISPKSTLIAVVGGDGDVLIHKLTTLVEPSSAKASVSTVKARPFAVLSTKSGSSSSARIQLQSWTEFLICCCSDGQLNAYRWSDLEKQRTSPVWTRQFTSAESNGKQQFNVWKIITDHAGRDVILAGADGDLYEQTDCPIACWQMETGAYLNSYKDHKNSVYCLTELAQPDQSSSGFISAGEDGDVRIWDTRASLQSVGAIKPFESECARTSHGRWIGCLISDGHWMICGGGTQLGLWHLASRSLVKPMLPTTGPENVDHYCGLLIDEKIVTSGTGGFVHQWNFSGDALNAMPTASGCVYDMQWCPKNGGFLTAVGAGSLIDLYSKLTYRLTPVETVLPTVRG